MKTTNIESKVFINEDELIIPEFIVKSDIILVPKKTHKSIDFISEELLKTIHPNIKIAKELCLYFLSMLTSTVFKEDGESKFKGMLATNLAAYFRKNGTNEKSDTTTYIRIIDTLLIGTPEKGPFILVDKSYQEGVKTKSYAISDTYNKCGFQKYVLKTKYVKDIKYRNTIVLLSKAYSSKIGRNNINFFSQIELPTENELLIKAKELVKNKHLTPKKKELTFLHRQKKTHWKDSTNRSFVEENITNYKYLTDNGCMIPIIGGEHCPRVYDAISLMPSWIRNEIKIDGKQLVQIDYKCLHPNLIINLYNGSLKYLTHKQIADELELSVDYVKTKHLSFFNMKPGHMCNSKLYKFYNDNEPNLISQIGIDKEIYNLKHKHTSMLLFTLEVQIMTEVIKRLNDMNIYVGYAYDALFTTEENKNIVLKMMNDVVLEFNVFTTAEIKTNNNIDSNEPKIKNNIIILENTESSLKEQKITKKMITRLEYKEVIEEIYPNIKMKKFYRINEKEIYNLLFESQSRNRKIINNILNQFNN